MLLDSLNPDFEKTLDTLRKKLLAARTQDGHWEGYLASSALSTATSIIALTLVDQGAHRNLIENGLFWLSKTQNDDGGWGDTVLSFSNISTTVLCRAAFFCAKVDPRSQSVLAANEWIEREAGGTSPTHVTGAIMARYGKDLTFSIPILTACALSGLLGEGKAAWSRIKPLPFELAACPHQLFKWLQLPVVSYALPALIALGQVRHHNLPTKNPLTRLLRNLSAKRTLRVLNNIQPESGGFLEATPLTSFVVMSLAQMGLCENPVLAKGVHFLQNSVREDGSWPIDSNLATWVTTLATNALATDPDYASHFSNEDRKPVLDWLLGQQLLEQHPYTHADPGGWAWTDLSGGVPDADDTPGALLALKNLELSNPEVIAAAERGITWLVGLQNRDGGIPTFCRGWGTLPFDMSSPDLTAHVLRAFAAWEGSLSSGLTNRVEKATKSALVFLLKTQNQDGSWTPLWFGNQHVSSNENPTYGTGRVLLALAPEFPIDNQDISSAVERGAKWLLAAQNNDGSWGGASQTAPSLEETSVALEALAALLQTDTQVSGLANTHELESAIQSGSAWLVENTQCGENVPASPMGFYFASLWYYEELYPLVFSLSALGRVKRLVLS